MNHNKRLLFCLLLVAGLLDCGQKPRWQWVLESRCYGDPLIEGKNVFVTSESGEVISGNYETGVKNWSVKVQGPVLATPAIGSEVLYVATQKGYVTALDKSTGKTIWNVQYKREQFTSPLALTEKMILLGTNGGNYYALSRANGEQKWVIKGNVNFTNKAIISGPYILIGAWSRQFLCLNMDGSENWKFKAGEPIVEEALLNQNTIFFTSHDHYVYALDVPTGKLLWRYHAIYPTAPQLIRNQLVFGSQKNIFVVNPKDGNPVRSIVATGYVERNYNWNNSLISVCAGRVDRIDTESGKYKELVHWKTRIFKVAFGERMLVVSDDTSSVFGFPQ